MGELIFGINMRIEEIRRCEVVDIAEKVKTARPRWCRQIESGTDIMIRRRCEVVDTAEKVKTARLRWCRQIESGTDIVN